MHAVAQQTPWEQKPESHSAADVQATPVAFFVQLLPLQILGTTQSALAVQLVLQAPVTSSQAYFPHEVVVAAAQLPAPSQSRGELAVEPVQLALAHCVPLMCLRQAPAPLQVPSLPHVVAAAAGHCAATSGGSPAAIGEHVPTLSASEQDMHMPVQALLQQTLFTQNPDAQSEFSPDEQIPPTGILPQLMFTQLFPDVQSAVVLVHDILHAPAPH